MNQHPAGRTGAPRSISLGGMILICLASCLASPGCTVNRTVRYRITSKYKVSDPQFAQTMGNLLGPALISGNSVKTLRNGDQIFPAMLEAIRGAQKTITFETYIYWSGAIGKEFTDALSDRARAGVQVYVLIDWLGSGKIDHAYLRTMKEAGVHVREYHPIHFYDPLSFGQLDHRTHRKLLIIDGKVGFTGGVGIADIWLGNADRTDHWRDTHYRLAGPAVAQLQAVFMDNWMQTTGEVLHDGEFFPAISPAGDEFAQVFKSSFQGGSESMQLMFLLSIAAADREVLLESAYFVPDELTIRSLIDARKRGARVEVIVPGPMIDEKIVRRASRAKWGRLLKEGVKIYEYQPTMFHCKLLIVDGLWVSLGSSNMDNRSFRLNDEANLNVLDAHFADEQARMFEDDKQSAREITYQMWEHRPLKEKLIERLTSLLAFEL